MKPRVESVPLAAGLAWCGAGWLYQEKSDGVHEFWEPPGPVGDGTVLNAERMHDGTVVVNDAVRLDGTDYTRETTAVRWAELQRYAGRLARHGARLCAVGVGGEFLAAVLARGGEGVVRKPVDSIFGCGWEKCKRAENFVATVTELYPDRGAVRLTVDGLDAGRLALRSRFEAVRLGSVLKVVAFGRHNSGLLREARLDADTPGSWLVRF